MLICPATSLIAVDATLRYPGSGTGVKFADYYRWLASAYAATVTTLPIITVPWRIVADGMPRGHPADRQTGRGIPIVPVRRDVGTA